MMYEMKSPRSPNAEKKGSVGNATTSPSREKGSETSASLWTGLFLSCCSSVLVFLPFISFLRGGVWIQISQRNPNHLHVFLSLLQQLCDCSHPLVRGNSSGKLIRPAKQQSEKNSLKLAGGKRLGAWGNGSGCEAWSGFETSFQFDMELFQNQNMSAVSKGKRDQHGQGAITAAKPESQQYKAANTPWAVSKGPAQMMD